ncbi:DMT family transporter [Flavobacteriales bacterium]|nr:DMT family transporter [Flavobacteriales bacterium]
MIYIAISILLFNLLVVFFKLFEKYNVDNLQALIANYFTSGILSLLLLNENDILVSSLNSEWFIHAIILGILFISIFNIYALGVQKIGVATTSVINKMSFIIPVIFSIVFYENELFSINIFFGVMLALIGIYLSSTNNSSFNFDNKYLWIIFIIFFGQGVVDIVLNDSKFYIPKNENILFFLILFLSATTTGILILFAKKQLRFLKIKNLLWGAVFGIPNFFSIFYFLKALQSDYFIDKSYLIFPLTSVGIVVTTTILGMLLYKEILTRRNLIGIVIAIVSILIISL